MRNILAPENLWIDIPLNNFIADVSGNNIPLASYGTEEWATDSRGIGYKHFNGSSNKVNTNFETEGSIELSFEAIVNRDATNSTGCVVGEWGTFIFREYGNRWYFRIFNAGGTPYARGQTDIVDGQDYHVVGTWANGALRIYINGVLEEETATSTDPLNASTTVTSIGWCQATSGKYFDGRIGGFRLFKIGLTGAESNRLYKAYKNPPRQVPVKYPRSQRVPYGDPVLSMGYNNGLPYQDASGSDNLLTMGSSVDVDKEGGLFHNSRTYFKQATMPGNVPITITLWMKDPYTGAATDSIFASGGGTRYFWFEYVHSSHRLQLQNHSGGTISGTEVPVMTKDKWYFIVLESDNVSSRIYYDNVLIHSEANTGYPKASDNNPSSTFECWMRGFNLYNRLLGTAEKTMMYKQGVPEELTLSVLDGTRDLSVNNTELTNYGVGVGKEMVGDGTSDIRLASNTLSGTTGYTISFWVKIMTNSTSTQNMVIGERGTGNNYIYLIDRTRLRFRRSAVNNLDFTTDCLFYNRWRKCVLVADGTNTTLYLDDNDAEVKTGSTNFIYDDLLDAYSTTNLEMLGSLKDLKIIEEPKSAEWALQDYLSTRKYY